MFSENVILIDADYIDNEAFNLTVNFERMLGRRIPKTFRDNTGEFAMESYPVKNEATDSRILTHLCTWCTQRGVQLIQSH